MAERIALDRIDKSILQVLQSDGRITNASLSDAVNLSASACLARVKRLEEAGVISSYKAQVEPGKIAAHITLYAHIRMSKHNPETSRRMEAVMNNIPEIVEASYTSGQLDYIARVIVPDLESWTELADELMARDDLHIETITTHVVMRKAKRYSGIPLFNDPS